MKNIKKTTRMIVQYVGGANNIMRFYHYATRIRFVFKDKSKFNIEALKAQPDVLGAVQAGKSLK